MKEQKKQPAPGELAGDGLGDATGQVAAVDMAEAQAEELQGTEAAPGANAKEEDELAKIQVQLEEARGEIQELTDRLFRSQADFENYRRRVQKEKEDLAVFANQKLLLSLLPVLDNLERALGTPAAQGDEKLRQGVELTARSFREILGREGLTAIESVGKPFDPVFHEAVATVPSDEHEDGTVLLEFQKGYKLGDRVIRPSMVQVSKRD